MLGSIQLPGGFAPQRREWRNEVAKRLRQAKIRPSKAGHGRAAWRGRAVTDRASIPSSSTRSSGPSCRAAGEAERVAREIGELERRVARQGPVTRHTTSTACSPCCRPTATSNSTRGSSPRPARCWPGRSTSAICSWPRSCGPACSTDSAPPTWPHWSRSSCTSTAARSRRPPRGSPPTTSARDGRRSPRSAKNCGPRSAPSGLAEHRPPDPTFAADRPRVGGGGGLRRGGHRRGAHRWRLRARHQAADRHPAPARGHRSVTRHPPRRRARRPRPRSAASWPTVRPRPRRWRTDVTSAPRR